MSGLKDLIGRRFRFGHSDHKMVVEQELPSATWFHADGTVVALPETEAVIYSAEDAEFVYTQGSPQRSIKGVSDATL